MNPPHTCPRLFRSAASALAARTSRWFEPVDAASLVAFRIAFGILMFVEVIRFFSHGWIDRYFIVPTFHFTYFGFGWVRPWAWPGMHIHFAALGILALFVAAGIWYRMSAALFFLGFTHVFLLDQARYLNHFYLICLLSFLLVIVPAHRSF
jgi:vitamin K-dependent gamma-carboxylase